MRSVHQLILIAKNYGFESYGSFNEGELQHEILTCTKNNHSGEVIDIYYNWNTGEVSNVEYSTQFKGQVPSFKFAQ